MICPQSMHTSSAQTPMLAPEKGPVSSKMDKEQHYTPEKGAVSSKMNKEQHCTPEKGAVSSQMNKE